MNLDFNGYCKECTYFNPIDPKYRNCKLHKVDIKSTNALACKFKKNK